MAQIQIDDQKYTVVESLGYNHDVEAYVKIVRTPDGEKTAVKYGQVWRFWTAKDRVQPLVEAIAQGWPNKEDLQNG